MGFDFTSISTNGFVKPDGWHIVSVKDVATINESIIRKDYPNRIIEYIDIASVEKGTVVSKQELLLEQAPSRAKRIVHDHDTLIATVRPNLEHYVYIKKAKPNTVASTGFAVITAKKVNPRFLYYYLTTKPFTAYLTQIADSHTSAYPAFNPDVIESASLLLPPPPEQDAIASILGTLDDKIELNYEMNKSLEAIVQAIFKNWFIDFEPFRGQDMQDSPLGPIPIGWGVEKLEEIAAFVKGLSYRSEDLQESETALVTLKSIARGGGYQQEGLKPYTGGYKLEQRLEPGEVVIAHTDLTQAADVLGRAARVQPNPEYKNLVASLDLVIVRPKEQKATKAFLFTLLSQRRFVEHAFSYANGTTVLHLSKKALPEYEFVLPPRHIIEKFSEIVDPLFRKIDLSENQSHLLSRIRDNLLPKLLAGEIKISNVKRLAGDKNEQN